MQGCFMTQKVLKVFERSSLKAFFAAGMFVAAGSAWAGPYDLPINLGVSWLSQQANPVDGSWGANDLLKYTETSEAVLALAAVNQQGPGYYSGISWLSNHTPSNQDAAARRVLALSVVGASLLPDVQELEAGQKVSVADNNGWGLSSLYEGSPLDTALVLQALNTQSGFDPTQAIGYLAGAQLSGGDSGWAVGQEDASDPFTTAEVIMSLMPYNGSNSTAATAISAGLTALNAKVTASSSVPQIAITILADLRYSASSSAAAALLPALVAQQAGDGSWGGDPYATALALRALAAATGKDAAAQKQVVSIPDYNLRSAINKALGHSALDVITVGELQQQTSLSLAGRNISDLTGLEYATNLTYLDVSDNPISSYAPLSGLTQLTVVYNGDVDGDGKFTLADSMLLQRHLLGIQSLNSAQESRAHLASFGATASLGAADLLLLQEKILNLAKD